MFQIENHLQGVGLGKVNIFLIQWCHYSKITRQQVHYFPVTLLEIYIVNIIKYVSVLTYYPLVKKTKQLLHVITVNTSTKIMVSQNTFRSLLLLFYIC